MPVVKYNGTTNTNASEVIRRAKARTAFANQLINTKTLDQQCLNRVAAGPAATTSYDGTKYIDQRLGAIFTTPEQAATIVETSPCLPANPYREPIVYPSYELTCSDPLGIQIMATGTFTRFRFTTTTQGAGIVEFQFFLGDTYVSSQLVVLDASSPLITPPEGINEVRYVFKCNPISVTLDCEAISKVLQWTNPYQFTNPGSEPTTLTLYKHPIDLGETIVATVGAGETYTPTPSWGYDLWEIAPC